MTLDTTPNAIGVATAAVPAPGSRVRRWLLIASLALNVLLLAAIGSAFWRFGGHHHGGGNIPGNLIAYASTLPRDRTAFIDGRAFRQAMAPLRRDVRDARRSFFDAMSATPFNKDVFDQAQSRVFDAESRLRQQQGQFMSKIAAGLTDEERRTYLNWSEQRRLSRRRMFERRTDSRNGPPSDSEDVKEAPK